MIKVISPLFVDLPRKTIKDKRIYLNLNTYLYLHFAVISQTNHAYKEIMREQLKPIKMFQKPVILVFTLFKGSKRKMDRSNTLSMIDKFFCDALVEFDCLEDDCDDFIDHSEYYSGGIDRKRPRVEIEIKEIQ